MHAQIQADSPGTVFDLTRLGRIAPDGAAREAALDAAADRPLRFSLVIPARNEASDIAETLEACLAIDYPEKEIIVVDDSTDETPRIVQAYASRGVRLIHRRENRNGCCGARNEGMRRANGDVVVIINGDVRPRPDFLTRLAEHYERGADWVVCSSNAVNPDNPWSLRIHALELMGRVEIDPDDSYFYWSEGFSCRREALRAIGYIPGDFPVPFCRDNALGKQLLAAGYEKHMAPEILVDHIAHDTFEEFWRVRVARGSWAPIRHYFFHTYSTPTIVAREAYKCLRGLLRSVTLAYPLWQGARLAKYVGWRHLARLVAAQIVEDTAFAAGSLKGLWQMFAQIRAAAVSAPAAAGSVPASVH